MIKFLLFSCLILWLVSRSHLKARLRDFLKMSQELQQSQKAHRRHHTNQATSREHSEPIKGGYHRSEPQNIHLDNNETLVACQHCQTYVPKSLGFTEGMMFYCSSACHPNNRKDSL